MIMNSSTIPLSTDYATKRRKTSNKRQVCYLLLLLEEKKIIKSPVEFIDSKSID